MKRTTPKRNLKKLKINRETLRALEQQEFKAVVGGYPTGYISCKPTGCQTGCSAYC